MSTISTNPQKSQGGFTPLRQHIKDALGEFGNMSASRVDGDVGLLMVSWANNILEDVMQHPYWTGGVIKPYKAIDEIREVPDRIIKDGLTYRYSKQQGSKRKDVLKEEYYMGLSQTLYRLKFGVGHIDHEVTINDKNDNGYIGPVSSYIQEEVSEE